MSLGRRHYPKTDVSARLHYATAITGAAASPSGTLARELPELTVALNSALWALYPNLLRLDGGQRVLLSAGSSMDRAKASDTDMVAGRPQGAGAPLQ